MKKNMSVSKNNPNYKDATINKNKLFDMVDIFQIGQSTETQFETISFNFLENSSSDNKWPTK